MLLIYWSIDYKIEESGIIPTIFPDMQTNHTKLFSAGRDILRVTIVARGYCIHFCHSHILSLIFHQIWLDLAFNFVSLISWAWYSFKFVKYLESLFNWAHSFDCHPISNLLNFLIFMYSYKLSLRSKLSGNDCSLYDIRPTFNLRTN